MHKMNPTNENNTYDIRSVGLNSYLHGGSITPISVVSNYYHIGDRTCKMGRPCKNMVKPCPRKKRTTQLKRARNQVKVDK